MLSGLVEEYPICASGWITVQSCMQALFVAFSRVHNEGGTGVSFVGTAMRARKTRRVTSECSRNNATD